jgi:hypothetical protein
VRERAKFHLGRRAGTLRTEDLISSRAVLSDRFWRTAILAAATALGTGSYAEAALYFWSDSEPGFFAPSAPMGPPRRHKPRRHSGKKPEGPFKESAKPQGPLIIAISIEGQNLKIYDANGFFAQTPISTGMRGHPTPMGVFSVIQKQKLHHSNIYSNAPMPYMQRITWSGVAMHAGLLPGYPASHGCIRMPTAFAVKMWGWTRMGARVVVTPGEITPAGFSHPLLATRKVVPQPSAADEPKGDAPSDAKADADATIRLDSSVASLELRSTVGHDDRAKLGISAAHASTPLRDQTHTAEAKTLPLPNASVTMTDAASTGGGTPATEHAAAGGATVEDIISPDDKLLETELAEARAARRPSADDAATSGPTVGESTKADETKLGASADGVKAQTPKDDPRSDGKTLDSVRTVTIDVPGGAPDVKKDQARLQGGDKTTAPKVGPAILFAPKRNGQISVLVSRKDSKLYVRQNFAPLFSVPIAIAPSDRPLGTHVFTAQVNKDDANVLQWSVISLPAPGRNFEPRYEDQRASRRRKLAGGVEMKPMLVPDSPAEALDRLAIPADAMSRIIEALSSGGSIIVSDQGIAAGETGAGTDFIVSLR